MIIHLRSATCVVIELTNGKKYKIQAEEMIPEHLFIASEDEFNIAVEGFTDRTVKLGYFKGIKIK